VPWVVAGKVCAFEDLSHPHEPAVVADFAALASRRDLVDAPLPPGSLSAAPHYGSPGLLPEASIFGAGARVCDASCRTCDDPSTARVDIGSAPRS
jgi:hypothetical protein